MEEADIGGLSDRGSNPLRSIRGIRFRVNLQVVRIHNDGFNISLDDAFLLIEAFVFYVQIFSEFFF